jgi:hypothetical protein
MASFGRAKVVLTAAALACLGPGARAAGQRPQPQRFAFSTTAAFHRIALPAGATSVHFSPLEARLEILGQGGKPLTAAIPEIVSSTPCAAAGNTTVFTCKSSRLDVALVQAHGKAYLDLRELRGLPSADDEEGAPRFDYPPEQFELGAACPGDTLASRGECAFERGQLSEAERLLGDALSEEGSRRFAALRLGDLALHQGDADGALAQWRLAAGDGPWGRLASGRIAELTGNGLFFTILDFYDVGGLPDRLREEVELREIRALAILRRWDEAMPLVEELGDGPCVTVPHALCHRVVLAALRSPDARKDLSISAYLRLPNRTRGPLAGPLARAAAAVAGELGAPVFGATLMAATVRETRPAELQAHLRQAFELYLAAGDPVRAQVIGDYAKARIPGLTPQAQLAWDAHAPAVEAPPPPVALAQAEQSEAYLTVARSTLARARLVAVKGRR